MTTWSEFLDQVRSSGWSTVKYTPNQPDAPIEAYTGTAVGKRWENGRVSDVDHTTLHADRQTEAAERAATTTAKEAFARLDQIINADPRSVTNRQVIAAVQDLARMVKALGRRELV